MKRPGESGQVSGEYAIVIGVMALVVIVAVITLGAGIRDTFQQSGNEVQRAPFQPPRSSGQVWPTSIADCEDDGWRGYPQFSSEDDCRRYVEGLTP